jgi:deoxyribonuclease V
VTVSSPTAAEARALQPELAARVVEEDRFGEVRVLAGVDVSTTRFDPERLVYAAVVCLSWPGMEVLDQATAVQRAALPYIPGLLGFREVPALQEAFGKLRTRPDLVLVDGHGRAHPRGLGIASHLGVVLDIPTIGVAKSVLVGKVEGVLPDEAGARAPLVWKGARIGTALRSRARANPLFISTGHRISLESAVDWVERCGRGRRLPEPTRLAHEAAGVLRRQALG